MRACELFASGDGCPLLDLFIRDIGDRRFSSYHRSMVGERHTGRCFLCDPEPEWTWLESRSFRAVLGLGPVGPGYTLIATKDHEPSMFDLDDTLAKELSAFTAEVRGRLRELWGPSVVAEHGRVSACTGPALRRHEPHCLHAHRLVFPGQASLALTSVAPQMPSSEFESYLAARHSVRWTGQYLYVEADDGRCTVGLVEGPLPRQFLRFLAARQRGTPELADWRTSPRPEELDRARELLRERIAA